MALLKAVYNLLWGELVQIPLPGGSTLGLSLLVMLLVPAGVYFTVRTRFLPFRLFPEMVRLTLEKNGGGERNGISGVQALIVSTACRVGMGNLVGVVAAEMAATTPTSFPLRSRPAGGRGRRHLGREPRGRLLEGGDGPPGFFYCLHTTHPAAALQPIKPP